MTFVSHSCDPKITYCITLLYLAKYLLMYLIICRGVSVDEKGYIYVADSGNNRIQIFNPDGTFLRCFGRWGQVNIFLLQLQTFFPCNIKSRFPSIQVRKLKNHWKICRAKVNSRVWKALQSTPKEAFWWLTAKITVCKSSK